MIESLPSDPAGKSGQAISQHQTLAAIIKSMSDEGQHPGKRGFDDSAANRGSLVFHRAAVAETVGRCHCLSAPNVLGALYALRVGARILIAYGVGITTAMLERLR